MPNFHTTLYQAEGRPVTGIVVPPEIVAALGAGKKPLVKVTINGVYTYRNAIAVMGGSYMVGVSAEHRAAAGVKGGDAIAVELQLDIEPREVEVPLDFAAALASAQLAPVFEKLAPSHRKEHVRAITEAKSAETRQRRIEKAVAAIATKAVK